MRVRQRFRSLLVLLTVCILGCRGDAGTDPVSASPAGFMMGSWVATSLVLTNQVNQVDSGDIVSRFGAVFTFDVQESGRYLAILSAFGQSSSESGRLTLSGELMTMRRELPSPETTVATVVREGVIVRPLDGFGLTEHVRISVGLPEENERTVKALRRLRESGS